MNDEARHTPPALIRLLHRSSFIVGVPVLINPPPKYRKPRERVKCPPAPAGPSVSVQDVLSGDHTADWEFDSDIVSIVDIAPLKISGASPIWMDFFEGNVIRVSYDFPIDVGLPWTCDGSAVAVFANGGTLRAGSGETIEG